MTTNQQYSTHPDLQFPLVIGREYYWSSTGYSHVDNTVEIVHFLAVTHTGTLIIRDSKDRKLQETKALRLLAPVKPISYAEEPQAISQPDRPDRPARKLIIDEPDQPPTPKPNWRSILTFGMRR